MTTAEAGQPERLEIVGDRAMLTLTRTELSIRRFSRDVTSHLDLADPFATVDYDDEVLITSGRPGGHVDIHRNLVHAIRDGGDVAVSAAEGSRSLEVGNAIVVSGARGEPVDLPLSRDAYPDVVDALASDQRRRP